MKRTKMIEELLKLYKDFPEGASDYHKVDFLLRKAERLGMFPPIPETYDGSILPIRGWDEEDETDWEDV